MRVLGVDDTSARAKQGHDEASTKEILTVVLNIFRILAIYLKPILPSYVAQVEELLGEEAYEWKSIEVTLENHPVGDYAHLAKRIDSKLVDAMVEESAQA